MTTDSKKEAEAPPAGFTTMGVLWPQTLELQELEDLIEEHAEALKANGGKLEEIPAIAQLLAFAEDKFLEQLKKWALKSQVLRADAEAAKIERVRIESREKRWAKARESLNGYILRMMVGHNLPKLKTPEVTISVSRNSRPSVRATSEGVLEDLFNAGATFVKRTVTYSLDADAVLQAHEAGEALPDGIVVELGQHVRIS